MKPVVAPLCQHTFVTILCNMETHVFRTSVWPSCSNTGQVSKREVRFVTKMVLKI